MAFSCSLLLYRLHSWYLILCGFILLYVSECNVRETFSHSCVQEIGVNSENLQKTQ